MPKPSYTRSSQPVVAELQEIWANSGLSLKIIVDRIHAKAEPKRVSRTTILALLQRGSPGANLHTITVVAEVLGKRLTFARL